MEFEFSTAPRKVPHDNKPITVCNCVPAFIPQRDAPRSLRASHSVHSESTALEHEGNSTIEIAHEKTELAGWQKGLVFKMKHAYLD